VRYAARIPGLSEPDLRWELIRLKHAEDPSADPYDRLKLAVFLTAAPAPFRDDARAQQLFGDYLQATGEGVGPGRDFAEVLRLVVQERQNYQRTMQSEERRGSESLKKLRRELAQEKERREALEKKLEAFLAIEKNLTGRDERSPPTP